MEQNKKAMSTEDLNDVSGGMKVTASEDGRLRIRGIDLESANKLTDWFNSQGLKMGAGGYSSESASYFGPVQQNIVVKGNK